MHPVGSDGIPKSMEPRKNGYYTNRSSFIGDSCTEQSGNGLVGLKDPISKETLAVEQDVRPKYNTSSSPTSTPC